MGLYMSHEFLGVNLGSLYRKGLRHLRADVSISANSRSLMESTMKV
jgi:hypothetical protein